MTKWSITFVRAGRPIAYFNLIFFLILTTLAGKQEIAQFSSSGRPYGGQITLRSIYLQ